MTTVANSYQNEIKKLRDRNDFLEEENRQLRKGIETSIEIVHFRIPNIYLTATECRVLGALVQADFMTKDAVYQKVYPDHFLGETPEIKIIDVFVCKLRRKLKALGIEIATVWGRGFRMEANDRQTLKSFAVHAVTQIGVAAA